MGQAHMAEATAYERVKGKGKERIRTSQSDDTVNTNTQSQSGESSSSQTSAGASATANIASIPFSYVREFVETVPLELTEGEIVVLDMLL